MSASFTEGLDVINDIIISDIDTMGSRKLFPSTSVKVIFMAPGAPGEQGVKRSSTITLGSSRDGPRTCVQGSTGQDTEGNQSSNLVSRDVVPAYTDVILRSKATQSIDETSTTSKMRPNTVPETTTSHFKPPAEKLV